MKRFRLFLLSLVMLIGWSGAKGQTTYISENFATASDSTPPTGWLQNQIQGAYYDDWRFDNPGNRTLNSPISSPAAIFDSDNYSGSGGSEDVALETPSFSVSTGATVLFEFDHYFLGGYGGEGFVEVYDGSGWVAIDSFDATTSNPQAESYDISSLVSGVSNAQVRFRWTGDYSWYWIVDNVEVYSPAPYDVGVTAMVKPTSGCLSGSETIEGVIENFGTVSLDTIPLAYQINSGTVVRDTMYTTVNPGNSSNFTFSATANLGTAGTYIIKVYTELSGDADNINDTTTSTLNNGGAISTYPYSIDWESGTGNWWSSSMMGADSWELGLPAQTNIDTAHSGVNAWMTDLDADYANDLDIALYSPCFDFSSLNIPFITFWLRIYSETDWDGMVLERSVDNGSSWIRVDSANTTIYNNSSSNLVIGAPMWSGDVAWSQYSIADFDAAGLSGVRYRFRFVSDSYVVDEGVAVDDFSITDIQTDISVNFKDFENGSSYCGLSSTTSVNTYIVNNGNALTAGDTVFVNYNVASVSGVDTVVLTSSLSQGDTLNYTLNGSFDLSGAGAYTLNVEVILSGDQYAPNNQSVINISNNLPIVTFPWKEDFDSYSTGRPSSFGSWTNVTYDDEDWDIESSGTANSSSTGPLNDHTTGSGNYIYTEASGNYFEDFILELPCVDFTGVNIPAVSYWYHMYGQTMGNFYVDVNDGSGWVTVDSIIGEQQTADTDPWLQKVVLMPAYGNQVVTIRLRGVTGSNFYSDISIDDIEIFEMFDLDATIAAHVSEPFCPGTNDVKVTIANRGIDTLFGVTINWSVNGVAQTSYTYSDTLLMFEESDTLMLGSYNFASGAYDLEFYTSGPNSQTDDNPANDTLKLPGYQLAMTGTYTIGGTSPDYSTNTAAINDLVAFGVCGAVTFDIAPGTYNEQITIPEIVGASAVNTITFDGGDTSLVTVTHAGTSTQYAVITLDGADYVSIKNMRIEANASTDNWGIWLTNQANNNSILNNRIALSYSSGIFDVIGIVASSSGTSETSEGDNANNTLVQGNYISGGEQCIHFEGAGTNAHTTNNWFIGNTLTGPDDYGIYLDDQAYLVFHDNIISDVQSSGGDGFYSFDQIDFDIQRNQISAPDYGLYLSEGNEGGVGRAKLINNMVSSSTDYAIYITDATDIDILHNTAYGEPAIRLDPVSSLDVRNNIFVSNGDYAFEADSDQNFSNLDYNNYFTFGSGFVDFGTSTYSDLSAWQSGASSYNANSISVDPTFFSATDLRTKSIPINNAGDSLGVSVDVFGTTRNASTPDIGAYEFTPPADDIAVVAILNPTAGCGDSTTIVEVVVQNYGTNSQSSVPVEVVVSGDINTVLSQTFAVSMSTGDMDTLVLTSTLNTYGGASISLSAYTELSGDEDNSNDTTTGNVNIKPIPAAPTVLTPSAVCGASSFALQGFANTGLSITWYDAASGGNVVATGSSVTTPVLSQTTTLYAEASAGPSFPIRITEVDLSAPDYVEIQNLSSASFDASGYKVLTSDSYTSITSMNSDVWSLGNFNAQEVQYKTDNSSDNYWGSNLFYNPSSNGWVMIIDDNGNVMDFVAWGWGSSDIANFSLTYNGNTYYASQAWSGAGATACSSDNVMRTGNSDNDDNADWTCASASKGSMNSGLSLLSGCPSPRTPVTLVVNAAPTGTDFVRSSLFQGVAGNGTASNPDSVCVGDTLTYELVPPTGFTYADFGTDWDVTSFTFERNFGTPPIDTTLIDPTTSTNAMVQYVASASEAGSVFKVELVIAMSNGCDTTLTNYIYVGAEPDADFSASTACDGDPVTFTNNSTNGTSYHWDFGDFSQPSTAANPSHTYMNTGTYTVTLTVTNGSCSDVMQKTVTVYDNPEADFATMNVCGGTSVSFGDSSVAGSGSISTYAWNFGDGSSSTLQSPTHLYSAAGTYTVTLTVTNSNGCSDAITKTVNVFDQPEADFVTANVCNGDSVGFTNTSTIAAGTLSYMWSFGDGNTSSNENPMHLYASAGFYVVKLVVSTTDGCMDSTTQVIQIYPQPQVNFSMADVCDGEAVMFTNNSFIASGSIASYAWDFGDSMTSTSANPSHTYAAPGTYTVTLSATSDNGCESVLTRTITVSPMPAASFSISDGCMSEDFMFNNTSSISSGTISYMWDFGDGSTSTDSMPTHNYTMAGTYVVMLAVTSDMGCESVATDTIEVYAAPEAMFTANNVCVGEATEFNNTSTLSGGTMMYMWDFGDGNTDTAMSPVYTYTDAGIYDVWLAVVSDSGCMDSLMMQVEVYDLPNSGWTSVHGPMGEVAFTANEQGAASYKWYFGDGDSSMAANPVHVYDTNDVFTVTLMVTTANGCMSTTTDTVQIINTSIKGDDVPQIRFEAYPNPFRQAATLEYELTKASYVTLEVYDLNGKKVSTLVNTTQPAGEHFVPFTATEHILSQGVYIVRLTVDGHAYIKRIVQVK